MQNSGYTNKIDFLSSLAIMFLLSSFFYSSACPSIYAASKEVNMSTATLTLASPAFTEGQTIPKQYTADGANVSPPLSWGKAPGDTQSFALICEDPDAPAGTWIHWIVYDIPANKTSLSEGVSTKPTLPDGSKQGVTSFHRVGYGGPSPPPGKPHRYYFKLYALNTVSGLEPGIDLAQFRNLIAHHKISQTEIMGTYGR